MARAAVLSEAKVAKLGAAARAASAHATSGGLEDSDDESVLPAECAGSLGLGSSGRGASSPTVANVTEAVTARAGTASDQTRAELSSASVTVSATSKVGSVALPTVAAKATAAETLPTAAVAASADGCRRDSPSAATAAPAAPAAPTASAAGGAGGVAGAERCSSASPLSASPLSAEAKCGSGEGRSSPLSAGSAGSDAKLRGSEGCSSPTAAPDTLVPDAKRGSGRSSPSASAQEPSAANNSLVSPSSLGVGARVSPPTVPASEWAEGTGGGRGRGWGGSSPPTVPPPTAGGRPRSQLGEEGEAALFPQAHSLSSLLAHAGHAGVWGTGRAGQQGTARQASAASLPRALGGLSPPPGAMRTPVRPAWAQEPNTDEPLGVHSPISPAQHPLGIGRAASSPNVLNLLHSMGGMGRMGGSRFEPGSLNASSPSHPGSPSVDEFAAAGMIGALGNLPGKLRRAKSTGGMSSERVRRLTGVEEVEEKVRAQL
ncbi:hypothetical protein T492DRAFT_300333 [Pavlovales sp. CCMP2436]|nr:hypothetical protein T492DRAFT_300333 [Pavlovales sp. CCMP2436]